MKLRRELLLAVTTLILVGLLVTGCYTWIGSWFPFGEFQHQLIPRAIYVHADDDFVLGSDILVREDEILVAGSRAVGTFNPDHSLKDLIKLNRSTKAFRHKPWYFFRQHDKLYVAGLKRVFTPYLDKDYEVLAIRGVNANTQDYEIDIPPNAVMGPLMVDFDGDGADSLVIVHPKSPTQVLIYDTVDSTPKTIVLPTFMPLQLQTVDLNCDGDFELFVEMLPLTEQDDPFELSVIVGDNNQLQPALDFGKTMSADDISPCARKSVHNFNNPRILAVEEEIVHLVEWSSGETAIMVHDQQENELERWDLVTSKGLGYISGWHEYRYCEGVDLAEATDLNECFLRRFAVISQSLTSCGTDIAPCGSMLVELFENGEYQELWRSPASTRISLLRENGEFIIHSGNSLVVQDIFNFGASPSQALSTN